MNLMLMLLFPIILNGQSGFSCFKLYEVHFTAKSGKIHKMVSDNCQIDYIAPQWRDDNLNSSLKDPKDFDYPICYTKGSKMGIKAIFKIEPSNTFPSFMKIKIKGECVCDAFKFNLKEKEVNTQDNTLIYDEEEAVGKTPDKIFLFDRLKIQWKFSYDNGQTWEDITQSEHRVYFINSDKFPDVLTKDKLTQPILHYTSVHIGCFNAKGQTDEHAIVDLIFFAFGGLDVRRVEDGLTLGYWRGYSEDGPYRWTATGLLRDGNETCGGWAHFLASILAIQGIKSDIISINTWNENPFQPEIYEIPSAARSEIARLGSDYEITKFKILGQPDKEAKYYFFVKNWSVIKSPIFNGNIAIDLDGVAGQGHRNPKAFFENHAMVKYKNTYYDPSYGKIIDKDNTSDKAKWEDDNIDAFGTLITKKSTGDNYFWVFKLNTQNKLETRFSK